MSVPLRALYVRSHVDAAQQRRAWQPRGAGGAISLIDAPLGFFGGWATKAIQKGRMAGAFHVRRDPPFADMNLGRLWVISDDESCMMAPSQGREEVDKQQGQKT